jgi:hypothetical protein
VFVSVCALAGWWILTTAFAVDPHTALNGAHGRYNGLINQLILVLLFIVVASTAASRSDVEKFLTLLVSALVPVSIYAVLQSLAIDVFTWPNPRPASTIGHPVPLAAMLSLRALRSRAFPYRRRGSGSADGAVTLVSYVRRVNSEPRPMGGHRAASVTSWRAPLDSRDRAEANMDSGAAAGVILCICRRSL